MKNILEEEPKLFEFINNSIVKNKKISHAYLIEVFDDSCYKQKIKEFVKILLTIDYDNDDIAVSKIKKQVDDDCYPDLKVITPDGSWIKKEQLLNLETEFSKKSMLDNKLIYVIDKAENLNESSANTMLKFLEEPNEGIIAILLTNNRYKVLDTILSRCQILSFSQKQLELSTIDSSILNFAEDININTNLIINYEKYISELFVDKESSKKILTTLEYIFDYSLESKLIMNNEKDFLSKKESTSLIKYIEIINEFRDRLQYNVNLKLWLTDMLIKIMEVR